MRTPLHAPQNVADAQPSTDSAETMKRAPAAPVPETANLQRDVIRRTRKLTGRL